MTSATPPSEIRVVATLSLLYVFRMLGLFMVFPVMMVLGLQYEDATPFLLGLALGIYGLTQAVFQIPLGFMSDLFGRKPIICLGLLIFAIGSGVAAMADSVWGLLLGRALQGAGAIAGAVMAMVGDLTSEKNRTRAMAVIGISIGVSFSVAMVLGPALASFGGLSAVFWSSALLAILGVVILFALVPTPVKEHEVAFEGRPLSSMLAGVVRDINLLRLNLGIFVLHFMLTAAFVVVPVAFQELGLAPDVHWHYYLPVMVLSFAFMLPFIYVAERKRQIKLVFLAAISVLILTLSGLSQAQVVRHWLLGLFLFFVAFNLLEAMLPSLISKLAPAGSKGTAMGVYSTCQFLGTSLGGAVGGFGFQYWGMHSVFVVCALMGVIWLMFAMGMRAPRYLQSVCVPHEREVPEADLRETVPGVVEARWVQEQGLLYLKVDDDFEWSVLNKYLQRQ